MQEYLSIQFLIYQIAAKFSSASTPTYRQHGLNLFGVRVLVFLGQNGPTTVGELARGISIEQPSLSHLLKRMTRDKLVTKRRQRHDNRTVQVRLTESGMELAKTCMEISNHHEHTLVATLNEKEVEVLKGLLARIFEDIDHKSQNENISLAPEQHQEDG